MTQFQQKAKRRKRGFEHTSGLLQSRIRDVSGARGFSESRLLTHWAEAVGEQTAKMCRPVKVSYSHAMGATLTLLTTGAYAPLLQAELPKIRERVNSIYGHNAISRIHITQTAPSGFSEGRVAFEGKAPDKKLDITPETQAEAHHLTQGVKDNDLRHALEKFAGTFMARNSLKSKDIP